MVLRGNPWRMEEQAEGSALAPKGYKAAFASSNRLAALARVVLICGAGMAASGCSLTMHLNSFQDEVETTASITPRTPTRLDPALDDEDWRRAQAALSLAVDPQGPGLPVNWDNPATKRKGTFTPSGDMKLVQDTICRPFTATLQQPGGKDSRQTGQACRVGPGEWAMRLDAQPSMPAAPGKKDGEKKDGVGQPLPLPTTSTLQALENSD